MKYLLMTVTTIGLLALGSSLTGCEEPGPAEQMGEGIDDAGEGIRDAAEDLGDR